MLRLTVAHPPGPHPVALVRDLAGPRRVARVRLDPVRPCSPLPAAGAARTLGTSVHLAPLGRSAWRHHKYVVYYLLAHLAGTCPELAIADQLLPHGDRRHLWDYSLWMLLWGLMTWGIGLAVYEAFYRFRPAGLEADLDRER